MTNPLKINKTTTTHFLTNLNESGYRILTEYINSLQSGSMSLLGEALDLFIFRKAGAFGQNAISNTVFTSIDRPETRLHEMVEEGYISINDGGDGCGHMIYNTDDGFCRLTMTEKMKDLIDPVLVLVQL